MKATLLNLITVGCLGCLAYAAYIGIGWLSGQLAGFAEDLGGHLLLK